MVSYKKAAFAGAFLDQRDSDSTTMIAPQLLTFGTSVDCQTNPGLA
jgi:hypothetical protein